MATLNWQQIEVSAFLNHNKSLLENLLPQEHHVFTSVWNKLLFYACRDGEISIITKLHEKTSKRSKLFHRPLTSATTGARGLTQSVTSSNNKKKKRKKSHRLGGLSTVIDWNQGLFGAVWGHNGCRHLNICQLMIQYGATEYAKAFLIACQFNHYRIATFLWSKYNQKKAVIQRRQVEDKCLVNSDLLIQEGFLCATTYVLENSLIFYPAGHYNCYKLSNYLLQLSTDQPELCMKGIKKMCEIASRFHDEQKKAASEETNSTIELFVERSRRLLSLWTQNMKQKPDNFDEWAIYYFSLHCSLSALLSKIWRLFYSCTEYFFLATQLGRLDTIDCHTISLFDFSCMFETACASGDLPIVRFVVQQRKDIDVYMGFRCACVRKHTSIVSFLLNETSMVSKDNLFSIFSQQSRYGHVEVIQIIFPHMNLHKDTDYFFRLAVQSGNGHAVAFFLLHQGVDPNVLYFTENQMAILFNLGVQPQIFQNSTLISFITNGPDVINRLCCRRVIKNKKQLCHQVKQILKIYLPDDVLCYVLEPLLAYPVQTCKWDGT
jgi:hypothetical protein